MLQNGTMLEQPADIVKRLAAEATVTRRSVKGIYPNLEQMLMKVHAAAGFAKERLGHECGSLPAFMRGHPCHEFHISPFDLGLDPFVF